VSSPRSRDHVWNAVLLALAESETIQRQDVRDRLEDDVQDRTVNRTMNAMEQLGWLEREKPNAHKWYAGPKAQTYPSTELYQQSDEEQDRWLL